MKRNIYFHENNSEKGIYRSLKGGFNGFTLLPLSLLKSPFSLFTLLSFQPFLSIPPTSLQPLHDGKSGSLSPHQALQSSCHNPLE